jgi:hypothetical protein
MQGPLALLQQHFSLFPNGNEWQES